MTKEMGMRSMARKSGIAAWAAMASIALAAMPLMAQTATVTTLDPVATAKGDHTVFTYTATVKTADGSAARGVVLLEENGKMLAGAALNATGQAEIRADSLSGDHNLKVVYAGDTRHLASQSQVIPVHADASTSSFTLSVAPTSITVAAPGDAATVVATITPGASFTGFLSLSCAGPPVSPGSFTDSSMPVGVNCTFTPANLEITSSTTTANSDFVIQTTSPAGQLSKNKAPEKLRGSGDRGSLALAILLPSVLGLGVLGRKRKIFVRAALVIAVGVVALLGTTACNPRYRYLNHPPQANVGTLPGNYTLTIWAQNSNGVTASEVFTTLPLTVQ